MGTASLINEPEYECALFRHRCLNEGITVVAFMSVTDIGSPAHLILLGLGLDKSPDITGAPKVLDCINPYALLPYFLYCFSNAKATLPPK